MVYICEKNFDFIAECFADKQDFIYYEIYIYMYLSRLSAVDKFMDSLWKFDLNDLSVKN